MVTLLWGPSSFLVGTSCMVLSRLRHSASCLLPMANTASWLLAPWPCHLSFPEGCSASYFPFRLERGNGMPWAGSCFPNHGWRNRKALLARQLPTRWPLKKARWKRYLREMPSFPPCGLFRVQLISLQLILRCPSWLIDTQPCLSAGVTSSPMTYHWTFFPDSQLLHFRSCLYQKL